MNSSIAGIRFGVWVVALVWIPLASAHQQGGASDSVLLAGLSHPWSGLDHLLIALGAGIWAAQTESRGLGRWLMALLGGTVLGYGSRLAAPDAAMGGLAALAIVALGVALMIRRKIPSMAALCFIAVLAVVHGHLHGEAGLVGLSAVEFALGLALATGLLYGLGVVAGLVAARAQDRAVTACGAAWALLGGVLAVRSWF